MTSRTQHDDDPFRIRQRTWQRAWQRTWFKVLAATLALVVAGAGAVAVYKVFLRDPECGDAALTKVSIKYRGEARDECVGVTDSQALEGRYERVAEVMREENAYAEAAGDGKYVTIAYLGPLTHPDPRVLHRLEGAVTGQRRANRENLVGERPRIRMVLANTGSDARRWPEVTETLIDLKGGSEHLVAVAGVGLSQRQTEQAAGRLGAAGLSMVGDIVTADVLNRKLADGLARVNPRVGEEVAALAEYLRAKTKVRRATLVSSGDQSDLYTASLSEAFKKHMGALWKAGGSYEDPFGQNPGNQFNTIINNICSTDPQADMVFFAGRAADLPKFIDYLGRRRCHAGALTVVTGSDAVLLTVDTPDTSLARQALSSSRNPVTLVYSPLAEPSLLAARSNPDAALYDRFRKEYQALGFDPAHLATGWGIMAHDAVLTAAVAVRRAAGESGAVPPAEEVRGQLYLTRASNATPGASGKIMIDSSTGDRMGLQLPVLRFQPGRVPDLLGTYPSKG